MIIDWNNDKVPPATIRDCNDRIIEVIIAACNISTGWIRAYVRHGKECYIFDADGMFSSYEFYVPGPLKIEWADREVGWKWFEDKVKENAEQQPTTRENGDAPEMIEEDDPRLKHWLGVGFRSVGD